MKKLGLSLTTLLLVLFLFNNTQAQKKREKLKDHKFGLYELNLTEQQKEKMKEIKFNQEESNIETQAKLKKNRLEIKRLITNNNFDENKLMALVEKSGDLESVIKKSKVKTWLEIRNILNDEQKDIWLKHFNQIENKRDKRFRDDKRKTKSSGDKIRRNNQRNN